MKLMITPIDKDAEQNGAWINYRGVALLIARANNTKFKAAFRRVTKQYEDLSNLPEEKSSELLAEALAEGILLGWKGFKIYDDNNVEKEVEYSRVNAKNLLINDTDCRDFVTEFSNEIENFIIKDRKKLVGE